MMKFNRRTLGVTLGIVCMAAPTSALAGGRFLDGRMTGGGKATGTADGQTVKVTHGFNLRCNAKDKRQNLQVNWTGGKFHLEDITYTNCQDQDDWDEGQPDAGFDTYYGEGIGRNGEHIRIVFTDEGEPGRSDKIELTITDEDGTQLLFVDDDLSLGGNHQAHRVTGGGPAEQDD